MATARTCCCSALPASGKTHLLIALGREAILADYMCSSPPRRR
ncbi:hypothetical protein [Bradyrhizobium sp. 23]